MPTDAPIAAEHAEPEVREVREIRFRAGGVGAAPAGPTPLRFGQQGFATNGELKARPVRWLGAPAPGGLGLPDAKPTLSQMYAPRGVWVDGDRLIICDTGNHRVMIWHGVPDHDHAPADVVLGQPDAFTEGAQAGGRGPDNGMRLPTGVLVHEGRMVVADAWNHRLLVWNEVPTSADRAPDLIVGQPDRLSVEENRGGPCGPTGFYWPFGISMVGGRFHVADTGNRRVLVWDGIPEPEQAPSVVLGQTTAFERDENRGEIGPNSFRWVHDIAGTDDVSLVSDAGNHRILGWHSGIDGDRPADFVLGQPDFASGTEFPYAPQSPTTLRFPYAIAVGSIGGNTRAAIADTANNRILLWDDVPTAGGAPAVAVLGQPDFARNGENRWDAVGPDTFCWPYGISLHNSLFTDQRASLLAVADSGNNRVMLWEVSA